MKIKPMIFNGAMVSAIASGNKTATRRPISESVLKSINTAVDLGEIHGITEPKDSEYVLSFAPFAAGDLIYVRETFCTGMILDNDSGHPASDYLYIEQCEDRNNYPIYKAQCLDDQIEIDNATWTPSIHMPRSASRLTLRVKSVKAARVQDITLVEVEHEGFNSWTDFSFTWSSIYQSSGLGWSANPYVWAVEFEVIHKNVDKVVNDEQ